MMQLEPRRLLAFAVALTALIASDCGGSSVRESGEPRADIQIFSQKDRGLESLLEQQIVDFQTLHKTIKVKVVHYDTDALRTNFQTVATDHQGPELVYGPSENIGPWVALKIIQPIDNAMGARFVLQFAENAVDAVSYRGHVYAAPDINGNHLMLLYNKKLVNKVPQNTDELIAMAKSLAKPSKNKYGLVFSEDDAYWLMPWLGGFGGAVFDSSTRPTLNTQAMVDALTFERSLKTQGVIPPDADYAKADSMFRAGQAAFMINGDWSLSGYHDPKVLGDNLGIAPLPIVSKTGKYAVPFTASRGYSLNTAATGEKLKAAKLFLQFITQASENVKVAAFGAIPTNASAAGDAAVTGDPVLGPSAAALVHGAAEPIVPEMRAVYEAMKAPLVDVMEGRVDPATAAATMQRDAESRIAQLHQ